MDIEEVRPVDLNLFSSFLSLEELINLKSISPVHQLDYFYDIWTLKESYTKALGLGLTLPLKQYSITKIDSKYIGVKNNGILQPYYFRQYDFLDNYKLSVCSKCEELTQNVNVKKFDEIIQNLMNN
ncbi:4'-phosphopantetheinyl transferase family protein [Peribacillus muralis]|uniref:4'-phosphopantetheinyl transferase family protein n=1 Tax=Peribacillus muralis TaxID=264697 RepID=UPI003D026597